MYDAQDIAERLVKRFGLGSRPTLRKALYDRLGKIVEDEGDEAYRIVAAAAADAAGKRQPDRYFVFVVMRRFIERGILSTPDL